MGELDIRTTCQSRIIDGRRSAGTSLPATPAARSDTRKISTRVQEYNMQTETKTKDNVFVKVNTAVQVEVVAEKAYEAIYRLTNPANQIDSYVSDVVRGQVPAMKLDDLFESKDEIAQAVKERLSKSMGEYGYLIHQVLVTDLRPDDKVRNAIGMHTQQIHQAHLRTSMTPHEFYEEAANTKHWEVVELYISGLTPYADEKQVRALCSGFDLHIVKVSVDMDPVRNLCKGRAKVMVRYNPKRDSINGLVRKLEDGHYRVEL